LFAIDIKQLITKSTLHRYAIQNSHRCTIWLKIVETLHRSSPEVFSSDTIIIELASQIDLSVDNVSSDYIAHLIRYTEEKSELIQSYSILIFKLIERLVVKNRFVDARRLMLQLIVPNMMIIDFDACLPTTIRLCSTVNDKQSLLTEVLHPFVSSLALITLKKSLALVLFDLSQAILNLYLFEAPHLSYNLLIKKQFYPWKDLCDNMVAMIATCCSYDSIVHDNTFSSLDDLEKIIEFIFGKASTYPSIIRQSHSLACESILRWANCQHQWSFHVYRMGESIFKLIDEQQINEDLCAKLADALYCCVTSPTHRYENTNQVFFVVNN
jgi:hypothetical protein